MAKGAYILAEASTDGRAQLKSVSAYKAEDNYTALDSDCMFRLKVFLQLFIFARAGLQYMLC